MNLENIKQGDVFKNYKELCIALDVLPKGGKSKMAHIRELERHFSFSRQKYQITIEDIYAEPSEKVQRRKNIKNFRINDFADYKKSGIYAIVLNNDIYIGSTFNFRERFLMHYGENNKVKKTTQLLRKGGIFIPLFFLDLEDDFLLRECENIVIQYFYCETNYNLINKKIFPRPDKELYFAPKEEKEKKVRKEPKIIQKTFNKKFKVSHMSKSILSIQKDDIDKVTQILQDNGIDFHLWKEKKCKSE